MTRRAFQHVKSSCDVEALLRRAGLTLRDIDDPQARIGARNQIAFLKLAAEALDDPLLGFRLAESFEPRELGLLFYVQASSATLGEALARVARYSSVAHEGLAAKCVRGNALNFRIDYMGIPRHTDRHQMEFLIAALVRICRHLTNTPLRPIRVRLAHPRCAASAALEDFLGQCIEFGAGHDEMTYVGAAADLPVTSADAYLNEALVRYWEDALERRGSAQRPLRAAVENAILPLLPHGKARIGRVAEALHLSTRTLARSLAAENLAFAQVLDELRADLATRYLDDSALSISHIAWLLGFQEASAFTHAFKRWTGEAPTHRRRPERTSPGPPPSRVAPGAPNTG
jgi:AraC-like DNA-binding protein